MMNGTLLYDLSLMNITTEKLISNIKRYINQKYYLKSENYRNLVFFDALYKTIDKNLPNINPIQKSRLRKIIINDTIKQNNYIINKSHIFKSTLELKELGNILVNELCTWLNSSLNSSFSQENIFKLLLFSKKSFSQNPSASTDEILAIADEKLDFMNSSKKRLFISPYNKLNTCIKTDQISIDSQITNLSDISDKEQIKNFSQNIINFINSIIKKSLQIKNFFKDKISNHIDEILKNVVFKLKDYSFKKSDLKYFIYTYEELVKKYTYFRNHSYIKIESAKNGSIKFLKSHYNKYRLTQKDLQIIINYLDKIVDNFLCKRDNIYTNIYLSKEIFLKKINITLKNFNPNNLNFKKSLVQQNIFFEKNISSLLLGYVLIFTFFEFFPLNFTLEKTLHNVNRVAITKSINKFDTINLNSEKNDIDANKFYELDSSNLLKLGNYQIKKKIKLDVSAFSTNININKPIKNLIVGKSISTNPKSFKLGTKIIIKFSNNLNYLDGIYTVDCHNDKLPTERISIFMGQDEINESRISKYAHDFGINNTQCYLVHN